MNNLGGLVGGAVVDDDDFANRVLLPEEALNGGADKARVVERRDDGADRECLALLLAAYDIRLESGRQFKGVARLDPFFRGGPAVAAYGDVRALAGE